MWIIFAVGASLLWGITYVINEQVYRKISLLTSLSLSSFFLFLVTFIAAYFSNNFNHDISSILASKKLLWLVVVETVGLILAELFIAFSITEKNATLSGLIEISYPIFIAIFAYILYRENEVNTGTIVGGSLIFIGVFIIYYFNK